MPVGVIWMPVGVILALRQLNVGVEIMYAHGTIVLVFHFQCV
jgi:hypothetical protein